MTAAIAPPLSRFLRSERYIASGQRSLLLLGAACHALVPTRETPDGGRPPGALLDQPVQRLLVLLALLRPPPWLARPPLLAISRCFAGSIAAKPRFEPPLFDPAMPSSLCRYQLCSGEKTQPWKRRFNSLI